MRLKSRKLRSGTEPEPRSSRGFTLIELLVVVAIIAILASLLLPAVLRGKLKAQGAQCMSNMHQLTVAWRCYTDDNADVLLFASGSSRYYDQNVATWCSGSLDFDVNNASNWDPSIDIMRSPMWPYCNKNLGIWRCPADHSKVAGKPRVRSICMNAYVGGFAGQPSSYMPDMGNQIIYLKYSQLNNPGPTKIFLFLDEREDAINWGNFCTVMTGYSPHDEPRYAFEDYPASYHGNACGMSYADCHSEIHRWRDGRTMPPLVLDHTFYNGINATPSPRNPDIAFLQDVSTRPK